MQTSEGSTIPGGVGQRVLSADSGLATVGGATVYGVVRAAQAEMQSSIVRGLRVHSNRKIGNLAVEALLAPQDRNLQMEVTSESLDGVMLMVGD
ncbi:hypothetical protein COHA_004663 [Chlorella ohadii]|uniref:Uncharacterized protein n=1 Tax=Chlorella ohadii TaxID=2649997 RepID=A0AAD5DSF0_9CHLO|nr:hypothetical protein COHA_004663 [Chlorella ohadii]